jgi:hypothetical protein
MIWIRGLNARSQLLLIVAAVATSFLAGYSIGRHSSVGGVVYAQNATAHPGAEPYIPTKIEWLTLELQAALQDYSTLATDGFSLDIANRDAETVVIYVTYTPKVDRESMNKTINSARKIIAIHAQAHEWEKWVKIREDLHRTDDGRDGTK